MFIRSMHSLRAIAMFLIVAGHCIPYTPISNEISLFSRMLTEVIYNGSSIFVLISGFFFYHVFYAKFNYGRFLKKKIRNIVFPYLFMSTIIVVFFRIGHEDLRMGGFFNPQGEGAFAEYLIPFVKYILFGGATTAYWYIPFIFLMFCLSPLHKKFADLKPHVNVCILLVALCVSMFVLRPENNINAFQSVVYYHFYYLAGIFFAKHYKFISEWVVSYFYCLLVFFMICAAAMGCWSLYLMRGVDIESLTMINRLTVPFKFLEFFVLYGVFEKFPTANVKPLSWFADMSFAVYFIHPIVISAFKEHWMRIEPIIPGSIFLLSCFFVIVLSLVVAFLFKKLFGDKTRVLVGW